MSVIADDTASAYCPARAGGGASAASLVAISRGAAGRTCCSTARLD